MGPPLHGGGSRARKCWCHGRAARGTARSDAGTTPRRGRGRQRSDRPRPHRAPEAQPRMFWLRLPNRTGRAPRAPPQFPGRRQLEPHAVAPLRRRPLAVGVIVARFAHPAERGLLPMSSRRFAFLAAAAAALLLVGVGSASAKPSAPAPDFGPNVLIFDPSMSTTQIQSAVDAVAGQQVSNQFGTQRYALLFKPGTYGSPQQPLNFQVGYYTSVAGLGASPNDVVVDGSIDVYNQCFGANDCIALDNFWRSLSNLTINVDNSSFGCHSGEFWAVSQAAPMRRVHVNGLTTLMDYCTPPSFAS